MAMYPDWTSLLAGTLLGGLLAGFGTRIFLARKLDGLKRENEALGRENAQSVFLRERIALLESAEARLQEALSHASIEKTRVETLLTEAQSLEKNMQETFENLGHKVLKGYLKELEEDAAKELSEKQAAINESVGELILPLKTLIEENDKKLKALEKQHGEETTSLKSSIELIVNHAKELNTTNTRLAAALSNSKGRGDWGELELVRLLESSGLMEGVHYEAQEIVDGVRPDIKVKLHNGRYIYIDAKTLLVNLERFEASENNEPQAAEERKLHAKALEKEVLSLSAKAYETLVKGSIDFVVLYVPRESMLRVALEEKPALMEQAFQKRVILASPLILMALLKTVAYGWDQASLSRNAEEIKAMGQELHKRAALFLERFVKIGERIHGLAEQYDLGQRSLVGRQGLIPQLRKFEDYGCKSEKTLPDALEAVDSDDYVSFLESSSDKSTLCS